MIRQYLDRVFLSAVLLSALAVLPLNIILPVLGNIAEDLHANYSSVYVTVSSFAIVAAISQLLAGPISDWLGRRNVALFVLSIFVLSSVGCALANDAKTFIVFRSAQGVVVAAYGVAVATIRDTSDDQLVASRLSYMAAAWAMVPIFGPTAGGIIDYIVGWRGIFYILSILGVILSIYVLPTIPASKSHKLGLKDYVDGYVRLLGSRLFLLCVFSMASCLGALYVYLGYAPVLLRDVYGVGRSVSGLVIGAAPFGFFCGSFLSGSMSKRFDRGLTMMIGRTCAIGGLAIGFVLEVCNVSGLLSLPAAGFFIGLGNGITLPNASSMAISLRKELTGAAVGLASATSLGGGGIIAFLCGWVLLGRTSEVALLSTLSIIVVSSALLSWFAMRSSGESRAALKILS